MNLISEYWIFLHSAADLLSLKQLSVKFLLVDQLPPAAQSLQFTEQSGQSAVLQAQLMDFFFLTEQVGHAGMFKKVMSWNFKIVSDKTDCLNTYL